VVTTRSDAGAKTFYIDNGIADLTSIAPVFAAEANDALLVPVLSRVTIVEAAPSGDSNTIAGMFNNLAHRIMGIIGAAGVDWKDAIPRTLTQLVADIASTAATAAANLAAGLALKVAKAGDSMQGALNISADGGANQVFPALVLASTNNSNSGASINLNAPSGGMRLFHQYNSRVIGVEDLNATIAFEIRYGETIARVYGKVIIDSSNIGSQSVASAGTAGSASTATLANDSSNLAGVAPTGWARRNAGSYVGNNTGQSINVGFQARFVIIVANTSAGGVYFCVGISASAYKLSNTVANLVSGVHIDSGNTFSVGSPSEANDSTVTYQWDAYS